MALKSKATKKSAKAAAKQAKKQAASAGKTTKKQLQEREDLVRRLIADQDLQADLRSVADAARTAYGRISGNPGALLQDEKVHKNIREASESLLDAKSQITGKKAKKKKRGGGLFGLLTLGVIGATVAIATVPGLRSKALDVVFGPEEELDYSAAAPAGAPSPNGAEAPAAAAPGT